MVTGRDNGEDDDDDDNDDDDGVRRPACPFHLLQLFSHNLVFE